MTGRTNFLCEQCDDFSRDKKGTFLPVPSTVGGLILVRHRQVPLGQKSSRIQSAHAVDPRCHDEVGDLSRCRQPLRDRQRDLQLLIALGLDTGPCTHRQVPLGQKSSRIQSAHAVDPRCHDEVGDLSRCRQPLRDRQRDLQLLIATRPTLRATVETHRAHRLTDPPLISIDPSDSIRTMPIISGLDRPLITNFGFSSDR